MPVTIEKNGETATWNGERWTGDGPLARLGNRIATEPPSPSDPAGLENARQFAAFANAVIRKVVAPENDDPPGRVY